LLSATLQNPGKRYDDVANAMLTLNHQRLAGISDIIAKQDIHRENVRLLEKLLQQISDPFIEYQLAKEYLGMGDTERARALFEAAWRKAPPSAHYKEPARKLAEKLAAGQHD
jgi:tetratricopeptide (TPR) repeat protein